jgi:hypothetical protein
MRRRLTASRSSTGYRVAMAAPSARIAPRKSSSLTGAVCQSGASAVAVASPMGKGDPVGRHREDGVLD